HVFSLRPRHYESFPRKRISDLAQHHPTPPDPTGAAETAVADAHRPGHHQSGLPALFRGKSFRPNDRARAKSPCPAGRLRPRFRAQLLVRSLTGWGESPTSFGSWAFCLPGNVLSLGDA